MIAQFSTVIETEIKAGSFPMIGIAAAVVSSVVSKQWNAYPKRLAFAFCLIKVDSNNKHQKQTTHYNVWYMRLHYGNTVKSSANKFQASVGKQHFSCNRQLKQTNAYPLWSRFFRPNEGSSDFVTALSEFTSRTIITALKLFPSKLPFCQKMQLSQFLAFHLRAESLSSVKWS